MLKPFLTIAEVVSVAVTWTTSEAQLQVIYDRVHFMQHIEGVEQTKMFRIVGIIPDKI